MTRHRPSRTRAAAVLVAAAAVLTGCGAPVAGEGADAPVAPDAHLLGPDRPRFPDCTRIDLDAAAELSAVDVPPAQSGVKPVDPADPSLTWANCSGWGEADASASGGGTSSAPLVWLVSFATSVEATSDTQRMSTDENEAGYRAFVRPARLGDARAEVLMDVSADDHQTLLVVTVFDPETGRPAARCGLMAARGDRANAAADWCLKSMADQFARPWLTEPPPSPSASPSATSSASPSSSDASPSPSSDASPSTSPGTVADGSPTASATSTPEAEPSPTEPAVTPTAAPS